MAQLQNMRRGLAAATLGAMNGLRETGEAVTQAGNQVLATATNHFETSNPYTTSQRGKQIGQSFVVQNPRLRKLDAAAQAQYPTAYKVGDLATGFVGRLPRALSAALLGKFAAAKSGAVTAQESAENTMNAHAGREARRSDILGPSAYKVFKEKGY